MIALVIIGYIFLGLVWGLTCVLKYFAETPQEKRVNTDICIMFAFNFALAPITLPATLLYRALR